MTVIDELCLNDSDYVTRISLVGDKANDFFALNIGLTSVIRIGWWIN